MPLKDKTVVVNGAAGGVGHFALQLAKWKGARVIAIGSGGHEAFLRDLGADEFIDYTRSAAEDVLSDVDLVIDAVGGPASGRFLRTLKRGGALFPIFRWASPAQKKRPDWGSMSRRHRSVQAARNFSSLPACSTAG